MDSKGDSEYTFPNGTKYIGGFKNGCFHGVGVLVFKDQGSYNGEWRHGELIEGSYTFEDGLEYIDDEKWAFCTEKDRRYHNERLGRPSGSSLIRPVSRDSNKLPVGTYDAMDGYYDPSTMKIHHYETSKIVRTPNSDQIELIVRRGYCG